MSNAALAKKVGRDGAAGPERGTAGAGVGKRTLVQDVSPVAGTAREEGPRVATPLPAGFRARMEQAFGADFSRVRVSEGPEAAARGAQAYVEGEHIHFAPGHYDPEGQAGQELIGHELAHVVQQQRGRAAVPATGGAALEHEADDQGARAARGERVVVSGAASAAPQDKLFTYTTEVQRGQALAPRQFLRDPVTRKEYSYISSYPDGSKLIIEEHDRMLYTYSFDTDTIAAYLPAEHDNRVGRDLLQRMNDVNEDNGADYGVHYEHNYEENYPRLWRNEYRGGHASPHYFTRPVAMRWELRPGRSASKALLAWLGGLTIAECATTLVAIQLRSVLQIAGEAKFDDMYGSEREGRVPSVHPLLISGNLAECVPPAAVKPTGMNGQVPQLKIGAQYYFENHSAYLRKHPDGALRGENAVYYGVNGQLHMFGGLGVPPVSAGRMCGILCEGYNEPRTPGDYRELLAQACRTDPQILLQEVQQGRSFQQIYEDHIADIHPDYRIGGNTPDQLTEHQWHADPSAGLKSDGIMLNPALYLMAVQYNA